jgi:hypothetical protein
MVIDLYKKYQVIRLISCATLILDTTSTTSAYFTRTKFKSSFTDGLVTLSSYPKEGDLSLEY